ncbi:MAG: hypothetical protein K6U74_04905 [Firmicutes bacterium]|nr:hypothetical protein [Bacillota bacterium]
MDFYESLPERLKAVAEKFVPFSARGNNFAFTFPMSKGMTPWKALRAYEDMIKAQVDPSLYQRVMPHEDYMRLRRKLDDACKLNGLDPDKMFQQAMAKARGDYYSELWKAVDKRDLEGAKEAARKLLMTGAGAKELTESGKRRGKTDKDISAAITLFEQNRTISMPSALKRVKQ